MLKRLLRTFVLCVVVSAPSCATEESMFQENTAGRRLAVSDCAFKAYAVFAACMEGKSPEGVTLEQALNAVRFLGNPHYDAVREKASDEKVKELSERFEGHDWGSMDPMLLISEAAMSPDSPDAVYRVLCYYGYKSMQEPIPPSWAAGDTVLSTTTMSQSIANRIVTARGSRKA